ncbi:MAG: isoprenylcysteine carboxylmethyltransferase family protein [Pseudomonadota bacterium]
MMTLIKLIDSPPVWTLAFCAIAYQLSLFDRPFDDLLLLPGWAVVVVGVMLALWALGTLIAFNTTPVPRSKPRTLVRKGPYRFSRNPIYLADLVILAGFAVSTGQPAGLLLVPVLAILISRRFISAEEEMLRRRFGSVYRAWRTETPRWI